MLKLLSETTPVEIYNEINGRVTRLKYSLVQITDENGKLVCYQVNQLNLWEDGSVKKTETDMLYEFRMTPTQSWKDCLLAAASLLNSLHFTSIKDCCAVMWRQ